jgi:hypothetical protein
MPFRQDPWCILSAPCAALDVRVAQRTRPKVAGGSEAKRAKTLEIYRFDPAVIENGRFWLVPSDDKIANVIGGFNAPRAHKRRKALQ